MEAPSPLPQKLCSECVSYVIDFIPFIRLCKMSAARWVQVCDQLEGIVVTSKTKNAYVLIGDNLETYTDTVAIKERDPKSVLKIFKARLRQKRRAKSCFKSATRRARKVSKDSKMICPECGITYFNLPIFNKHLRFIKKQMCSHCHNIIDKKSVVKHLKKLHNVMVFSCEICSETFEKEHDFMKHKTRHVGAAVCSECNMSFMNSQNLVTHLTAHEKRKCDGCNMKFTNRACYLQHVRKICRKNRAVTKRYICDYCSKEYSMKQSVRVHIMNNHLYGPQYQCDKCGKKFMGRAHLEEHGNTHNKVEDRFVCGTCGKKYSTRRGYQRHVKKHSKQLHSDNEAEIAVDSQQDSEILEETVIAVDSLLDSERMTKIKYMCEICNGLFASIKTLTKHMKVKHRIITNDYL